ncbi:hypothetical protein COO60DRAFT_1113877 [Scenedesmus sp. NREL 46B-D3]|nr:hypothetical protein COO60DRAFT_1113877 [Scenedesmus sp. NREL 46B-D3]
MPQNAPPTAYHPRACKLCCVHPLFMTHDADTHGRRVVSTKSKQGASGEAVCASNTAQVKLEPEGCSRHKARNMHSRGGRQPYNCQSYQQTAPALAELQEVLLLRICFHPANAVYVAVWCQQPNWHMIAYKYTCCQPESVQACQVRLCKHHLRGGQVLHCCSDPQVDASVCAWPPPAMVNG